MRTLINAARQIFDGELRDMNIASAAFRGYDTGFDQVDYAPVNPLVVARTYKQ